MAPTAGSDPENVGGDLSGRLRYVVDHAPIVLWACDRDGRVILSEGHGLRALGLKPGQVVGESVFDLYSGYPQVGDSIRRALRGEEFTIDVEVHGVAFESRYCPIREDDGSISGVLGVSVDVTERVRAEREHRQLQEQILSVQKLESLGLLAGGIAHDFNNILTAILGSASAAQTTLPAEHPARQDVENVILSARRAADLTRQMLAYSGRGQFEVRPIDLSVLLEEIVTLLEAAVPKKVQLRVEAGAVATTVEADVAQMQQLLMNLVLNGAEAIGDRQGTVLITTGRQDVDREYLRDLRVGQKLEPGEYVFVEVHDTGCGMDAATLERIFDPFFSTKFAGRGLGLAAVLGIVRSHGGALKVYSTPGRGTTFKVLLPATAQSPRQRDERPSGFRGHGLALVVDDDDGVRAAARRMLAHLGFEVIEAVDGVEGVAAFEARHGELALVLLDMTMPRLSGEEAFSRMRRLDQRVPILLTSGYNEIEATRRFTSRGLAGFMQKPFALSDLEAKLSEVLGAAPSDP